MSLCIHCQAKILGDVTTGENQDHGQNRPSKRQAVELYPPDVGQDDSDDNIPLIEQYSNIRVSGNGTGEDNTVAAEPTVPGTEIASEHKTTLIPNVLPAKLASAIKLHNVTITHGEQDLAMKIDETVIKWGMEIVGESQKYLLCLLVGEYSLLTTEPRTDRTITVELWFKDPMPHSIALKQPLKLDALMIVTTFNMRMRDIEKEIRCCSLPKNWIKPPSTLRELMVAELAAVESKSAATMNDNVRLAFDFARSFEKRAEMLGKKMRGEISKERQDTMARKQSERLSGAGNRKKGSKKRQRGGEDD